MDDPHLTIEDVKDLTFEELRQRMIDAENRILNMQSGISQDLLGNSDDEYKIALGKHDFPTSTKSTHYLE